MDRTAITTGLATAGVALVLAATPAAARDDDKAAKTTQASEAARDRAEARDENRRDGEPDVSQAISSEPRPCGR